MLELEKRLGAREAKIQEKVQEDRRQTEDNSEDNHVRHRN